MRQRSDYPTFSDQEMARRHQAFTTSWTRKASMSSGLWHRAVFLRRLLADRLAVQPRSLRAFSER